MNNYLLNWHPLKCKYFLFSTPHFFPSWNFIWKLYIHRCHSHYLFFVDKGALLRGFYKSYFSCNEDSAIQACLFSLLHVSVPWLMDMSTPWADLRQQRLSWKMSLLILVARALLVSKLCAYTRCTKYFILGFF